ncbi:MAG: hypothetical protein KBA61_06235 [Spirochaetes bacterium]|nr:hypothetical protein [Spirochaetota bacterium]
METTYYTLATKSNFNTSLRHFYKVNEVVDDMERRRNLADVINVQLDNDEVVRDQVLPIVGAVIRDKYGYSFDSFNVPDTVTEFAKISDETRKWTAVDVLLVYFNPNGEAHLINPKNPDHWERARELSRDQLMVIYSKHLKPEKSKKIEKDAIKAIEEMLTGKDVFINPEFVDQTVAPPRVETQRPAATGAAAAAAAAMAASDTGASPAAAAPAPARAGAAAPVSMGKKRMTPKYAVTVSNELFHNGNVEAWKKIVESYQAKFPDCKVNIFFEGELINDINSLFKWGKVKHGDSIFFQVAGENIQGVSKLQKYLYEGASQRFEQFLKIGVGRVLNLF